MAMPVWYFTVESLCPLCPLFYGNGNMVLSGGLASRVVRRLVELR